MQTKTYTVYKYDELSDEAKETAISDYRYNNSEYFWSNEYEKSLEAFADDFPVKITDWAVSPYSHSYINFDFTDKDHESLPGDTLRKHLQNYYFSSLWSGKYYGKLVDTEKDGTKIEKSTEHPAGVRHVKRYSKILFDEAMPTGYCADYDLRRPIYDFLKSKSDMDFSELMEECLESFLESWKSDMEYQDSDEYISEHLQANDYDFTINGKID